MSKTCLIRQPAGLGDIIFCQKIAKHFRDMGYEIIWPVIKEYYWVKNYIEGISFPLISDDFTGKQIYTSGYPISAENFLFLPLQDADRIYPFVPIIDAKYVMAGISHENWQNFFSIHRDAQKENDLYIKLNPGNDPYIFVNKNYGSPPDSKTIDFNSTSDIKVIEMQFYDSFSPFDWLKILENAREIHTVDTCLSCIIESTPTVNCSLFLYSRYVPKSFRQTKHLYVRNWNWN